MSADGAVNGEDISEWLRQAGEEDGKTYVAGDTNLDGEGGLDFTALALNFGNIGADPNTAAAYWRHGNFDGQNTNGDFEVGGTDFTALALNFGHQSANAVPEPEPDDRLLLPLALGIYVRAKSSRLFS